LEDEGYDLVFFHGEYGGVVEGPECTDCDLCAIFSVGRDESERCGRTVCLICANTASGALRSHSQRTWTERIGGHDDDKEDPWPIDGHRGIADHELADHDLSTLKLTDAVDSRF
jgi:hypothetical protein